jgi:hypothetical protein
MLSRHTRALVGSILLAIAPTAVASQAFPVLPAPDDVVWAKDALSRLKVAERGPFERLRWFCADGTVEPPQGSPCSSRGGGVQHAEPNATALRLASMGYDVGTILQAISYDDFADEARAGYRLRELVLERHLIQNDDGWVLRRARYYRGAIQVEDEERRGRVLLAERFSNHEWLRQNYLLATRLAATVPHVSVADGSAMDRIRAAATEIAEIDPSFQNIRVRIHSVPSPSDVDAVQRFLSRGGHTAEVTEKLSSLRADLVRRYDPERALSDLASFEARAPGALRQEIAALRQSLERDDASETLERIVHLAGSLRTQAEAAPAGEVSLDLIDFGLALQERAYVLTERLDREKPPETRAAAIERFRRYAALAHSAGFLSGREYAALEEEASRLLEMSTPAALEYKRSVSYLARSLDWARGTVRGTFAPVLDRYVLVEPVAASFPDAVLRGSVLLPLSGMLDALQADADAMIGATHTIFGSTESSGIRGLNPGVAVGPLRILEPGHHDDVESTAVYLLSETPPELKPVAGVLTLAEGNLLSHVQLLARNLGIPNATVAPRLEQRLRGAEGAEVFYAVTPLGRVIVESPDALTPDQEVLVATRATAPTQRHRLDTSRLRLDRRTPIPLSELRSSDSGVLVGPKAANLGQLAADFPGRVSGAVALPFGMFVEHADRPYGGMRRTVLEELEASYTRAAAMRAQGSLESEIDAFMLERLAWVRGAIEGLEWIPAQRDLIEAAVLEVLDGNVERGVFVRSDTNVEDLPEFSGAGLNLTVAHQTSMDDIVASIKRVWTSPFSERAYLWRRQILEEQGEVYPSVLLQETVPSEKSGVLITSGLQEGDVLDLTIVAAEGVGGAVEGEDAETLLASQEGRIRLLSQAKAPRRREVVRGGTRWVAAARPEHLLQDSEIQQLREVVESWQTKKVGTAEESIVWDIEYGFLGGRLWLFQIRPFVRFRKSDVYARLEALDVDALANAGRVISLADPLSGS